MKKICSFVIALVLLVTSVSSLAVTAETLPSLTQSGSYATSDNSNVYYYDNTQQSVYEDYIATLSTGGYTMVQEYSSDNNLHSLWTNASEAIYVSYLHQAPKMRVFVGGSDIAYHTEKTAQTASVCEPKLWQLDVDNSGDSSGGKDGGMSYVIRLTDGTFIIIDGGYQSTYDDEAKNLYALLCANNVLEGKPVVSAWFITHLHNDHYGALKNVTNQLLDRIAVKGFYYNFPSQTIGDISASNASNVEGYMKKWDGAVMYSKLHTGMIMGFAGATVEVLATHEDLMQFNGFYDDANDTSTVLRFTIEGQTILFLADAYQGVCSALESTYTSNYLKSDIMQLAHHGFDNGGSASLYETVAAKTLLWPMDITRYVDGECIVGTSSDTKTFLSYCNHTKQKVAYDAATDVFVAYKTHELSLPYTPVGYKSSTSDYTALAQSKVAVIEGTSGIKLQMKDDGSAIRFIGIVNVNDTDLADFDNFGFKLSFQYGGNTYVKELTAQTVFTSISAGGTTYTADSLGGKYLYAVEVYGLEELTEDVEFVITGIGTHNGNTYNYAAGRYSVTTHLSTQSSGDVIGITFADIISGAAGWTQK